MPNPAKLKNEDLLALVRRIKEQERERLEKNLGRADVGERVHAELVQVIAIDLDNQILGAMGDFIDILEDEDEDDAYKKPTKAALKRKEDMLEEDHVTSVTGFACGCRGIPSCCACAGGTAECVVHFSLGIWRLYSRYRSMICKKHWKEREKNWVVMPGKKTMKSIMQIRNASGLGGAYSMDDNEDHWATMNWNEVERGGFSMVEVDW